MIAINISTVVVAFISEWKTTEGSCAIDKMDFQGQTVDGTVHGFQSVTLTMALVPL
jgi:hypothetical protein